MPLKLQAHARSARRAVRSVKSLVMHNSAGRRCAQTGSLLPTEFSKSCDVDVSLGDSQSVVEYPPLVSSSHLSLRSAPLCLLRRLAVVELVGLVVVEGVGCVGWSGGGRAWGGGVSRFSLTQSIRLRTSFSNPTAE